MFPGMPIRTDIKRGAVFHEKIEVKKLVKLSFQQIEIGAVNKMSQRTTIIFQFIYHGTNIQLYVIV
jgi:hypothetical protein